jgi:hypothetical protein
MNDYVLGLVPFSKPQSSKHLWHFQDA